MKILKLWRKRNNKKGILGELYYEGQKICDTLELDWNNNETNISCIPVGIYAVKMNIHYGEKRSYPCPEIQNVPNRTDIEIHIGNFLHNILGCILVGKAGEKDGENVVWHSENAFNKMMKKIPTNFLLEIKYKE